MRKFKKLYDDKERFRGCAGGAGRGHNRVQEEEHGREVIGV